MSDLSQGAAEWWAGTMGQAKQLYEVWLKSTPLERLKITVDVPERLKTPRFVRTEQRGVTLLLKAVPEEIRKELISAREITSTGVLYRLLVTYQPGGPGERALILKKLTDLGAMRNYAEAATALREWRRYYLRAQEIGATLPDPTLLAVALERVVQLVNKGGTQAFRCLRQGHNLAWTRRLLPSGATRSCCWRKRTQRSSWFRKEWHSPRSRQCRLEVSE